jgi:hypothetical protein
LSVSAASDVNQVHSRGRSNGSKGYKGGKITRQYKLHLNIPWWEMSIGVSFHATSGAGGFKIAPNLSLSGFFHKNSLAFKVIDDV